MQRRSLDLPDMKALVADARMLHERGYEKAGNWDLAQACNHIAIPMERCIDGFDFNASWPMRLMANLFMKKAMFRKRSIKPGYKAPPSTLSEAGGDEAAAVERLGVAVERVLNHTGPFKPHPFLGPISVDEWHEFLTIHGMHHLNFLVPR